MAPEWSLLPWGEAVMGWDLGTEQSTAQSGWHCLQLVSHPYPLAPVDGSCEGSQLAGRLGCHS